MISRHKARKQAFFIIFEYCFHDDPIPEIMETAQSTREFEEDEFTKKLSEGVVANLNQLDEIIDTYAIDWNRTRISKVALSLLRISIYELKHMKDDVPVSVSINEAVELTKKYATDDDAAFVNGILGSFARAEGLQT